MSAFLRRVPALLAAAALLAPPLAAQRNTPATYAITNARLVPVSGPVIAKGTIVVRDGLIAAVGANVAVPADARVIDGTGLTVYPGLFDSYGSIGLPAGRAGGAGGGGAAAAIAALSTPAPAATATRSGLGNTANDPRGLDPAFRVVENIRLDEEALDGPRAAGITTALTVPNVGIMPGQSAIINLGGSSAAAMVVKPNVAQHISFGGGGRGGGGGGGYPGSLLGLFAATRQQLLDAQHYRDLKAAYDKNPRGMQRVEFDAGLEALLPAINKQQPVIMLANTQREIERALDLAKEFNLRMIIAGGQEADKHIDRLKAENVAVLLSLNFPRRIAAPAADAEPEPLTTLRERVAFPKVAGKLAAAGVKFAFQSGGLTTWTDFETNLVRAVDAGLAPDAAVKAVTLQPAEIFGVADRLGSLEVGKIANLTITRGELNERTVRVSQLFIDGHPVTVRAPAPAGGAGGGRGGTPPGSSQESPR